MSYAHPEYLVDTEWVASHLTDTTVRMIESDEDSLLYPMGHIQGAVQVDWFSTLQHPIRRDFVSKEQFEEMCSKLGISNDTLSFFMATSPIGSRAMRCGSSNITDTKT